ncbi:MAG: VWA domain-containing protein [Methanosphaera sp.]|nr:VWA domain-containing protein [Methanosphaera sp.]
MINKRIVALSTKLRDNGVPVSIRSTQTACDVWDIMKDQNDLKQLQSALQSVYIKDHHDNYKFIEAFESLFNIPDDKKQLDKTSSQDYRNPMEDEHILPEDIMNQTSQAEADTVIEKMLPQDFDIDEIEYNRIHEKDLLKADISHINTFDERIIDLCRKLGDRIANQRNHRKKRQHSNNIDMAKTIRKNLKNGGKLINLETEKPNIHKNKHIFLSDVSGSCDWISNWFFSIIYGCQKSFDKIYSYEFDSNVLDTTDSLNSETYNETYESIMNQRIKRGMLHGQSNMTKSFRQFRNMAPLNHRSIVILLSDCRDWRGKRDEDGVLESAKVLKEIVQKSSKVLIFNPEKKIRWNTPTSCVKDYEDAGAQVYEIENLDNLSRMIVNL